MAERLENLFTGYWRYLALRAACKLDLFEHIASGSASIDSLARTTGSNVSAMGHLVMALVHEGILEENDHGFCLSPEAARLCADHPQSVKQACLMWGTEHMATWQHLDMSIRSGQAVFPKLFGAPFFRYLDAHPERAREYHKAMFSYAQQDYAAIGEVLALDRYRSVMDVGGGNGALVDALLTSYTGVSFRIFDIQDHRTHRTRDVPFIQGDFFDAVPSGSDALLLSRVIHDWDDAQAMQILRNCHSALPREGALFLIENDLSLLSDAGHLLSLNMLAICGSRERSVQEYQQLLESSGFRVQGLAHHGKQAIIKTLSV